MIDLSILVLSIHTRYRTFGLAIQDQLWSQYARLSEKDQARVEILVLTDSKSLTIGAKRSILANAARGRYVQFVDDDDRVDDHMIDYVLAATAHNADVITFLVSVTLDGGPAKICRYSRSYRQDYNTETEYRRLPNHICTVRRELAVETGWEDITWGEDRDYSTRLLPKLGTEFALNRVLYHYDYSGETSESRS